MKVTLVNPPYLLNYGRLNVGRNFTFPMGLGYVAASLERLGHSVEILEPEIRRMSADAIFRHMREKAPDLVGVTCTTSTVRTAAQIAGIAKRACSCRTLLGGVHPSALPELTLRQFADVDFACFGEGDNLAGELLERIGSREPDYRSIPGLAFREGEAVVLNPPRPFIAEMDSLPHPARHLVALADYRPQPMFYKGRPCATINTSRGCPGRCTFCASFNSLGYRFRPHSPEYVLDEIDELAGRYGVSHLHMVDDTFTFRKDRAIAICEGILRRRGPIMWHCFARVDTVDEELLTIMKRAGCFSVLYGIETGDEEVMKNIRKRITLDQARRALEISNRLKLKTVCAFMFGNKGDTRETVRKTLRFAIELRPTIASFNIMVPFPGTQAYDEAYGANHPDNWDDFVSKGTRTLSRVEGMTDRELKRFQARAFWTFYGRPAQVARIASQVSNVREFAGYLRGVGGLAARSLEWLFRP